MEYVVRWLSPVFLVIMEQWKKLEVSYHKAPTGQWKQKSVTIRHIQDSGKI